MLRIFPNEKKNNFKKSTFNLFKNVTLTRSFVFWIKYTDVVECKRRYLLLWKLFLHNYSGYLKNLKAKILVFVKIYARRHSLWRNHRLITIKIPNPKCRLHRCFIEFIDCRYSQSYWYFRPALWTIALVTFSLVSSPPLPLPCVNKYTVQTYTVCNGASMGS